MGDVFVPENALGAELLLQRFAVMTLVLLRLMLLQVPVPKGHPHVSEDSPRPPLESGLGENPAFATEELSVPLSLSVSRVGMTAVPSLWRWPG